MIFSLELVAFSIARFTGLSSSAGVAAGVMVIMLNSTRLLSVAAVAADWAVCPALGSLVAAASFPPLPPQAVRSRASANAPAAGLA
ncbi:hypothetical protein D3C76_1424190 [compost metagenome]